MKKILFGILGLFMLLSMSACGDNGNSSTGSYFENGDHFTWDYSCDDVHKFGAWLKVLKTEHDYDHAVGFSVRMTQEEYNHYCLE